MPKIQKVALAARSGDNLMARANLDTILSPSRIIPFDQFVLSQSNLRARTGREHPVFRYVALREKGLSGGRMTATVIATLKLIRLQPQMTSLAPALLKAYAKDGMPQKQLVASACTGQSCQAVQRA